MQIAKSVYEKILSKYPIPPPEQGGILGMRNGVVCEYYHDTGCFRTGRAVYEPNVDILNQKIEEWDDIGIQFVGIVHSHMLEQETLSSGDRAYIKAVFDVVSESVDKLYFPIVIPATKQMFSFIAERNKKDVFIRRDEIHISC